MLEKKSNKPGRPSSIKDNENWERKTYRFRKTTLKKLKIHQIMQDDKIDLSVLIDKALKEYLK